MKILKFLGIARETFSQGCQHLSLVKDFFFQEREKTKSKLKFMKYLLQNQSAFALKKVIRQGNGNYVMTVKIIDQTGTYRQLVAILKETKVSTLNESQKKGKGSILNKTEFIMVHGLCVAVVNRGALFR